VCRAADAQVVIRVLRLLVRAFEGPSGPAVEGRKHGRTLLDQVPTDACERLPLESGV
jgi:hypothetical protein